jgi:nucleoside-diphosphate-sugar epimerase
MMQLNNKTIGIIGCGWLGTALAKQLLRDNYSVFGTTQDDDKRQALIKQGIKMLTFSLPADALMIDQQAIFQCSIVIICIPPNVRQGKLDYADNISLIVAAAERSAVEKIILISTTAIYGDLSGDIDESQALVPLTSKVKLLMEAEQHVLGFSQRGIVLRLAGLVGENRHPGRFFKKDRVISLPNAQVNLVHQEDVIGIISQLLVSEVMSGVYNIVSKTHLSKHKFYSIATDALGLVAPSFDNNSPDNLGRKVLSDKIRQELNYQFIHDDLVAWLVKKSL